MTEKARVLVLDDEPRILTSIRDLLEDDFVVLAALDGEAALHLLKEQEVSVILSDQRMPGLSGDQFLKRAAEISQATRILITAYADMPALVRAVNHGQIYAYIAKPWDPMELKVTVARAAHHYELVREVAYERDLLHALMDNVPDRIYFKDPELRFTRVNPAQASFLGLTDTGAAVGTREPGSHSEAEEREILRSGRPLVDREERAGGCWFSSTKVPIADERGRVAGLVGIARDITARKDVEEELERRVEERTAEITRLNQALEERLRALEAVNQELEAFTYSTSHDLRAPLRHIDGFSEIILEDFSPQLPEPVQQKLAQIRQEVAQMDMLINELLNLSRLGRRDPVKQITGLRSLVDEVLAEFEPEMRGRDIRVEIGELPFADCDPTLVKIVLSNLLSNAIKFTRPRKHALLEIGQTASGGRRAVFVRDNGVGFSMKYAGKLFGVFQRLHRREDFEGTGVGLAIVKRIVQRHGGEVWAEAETNKGATFYFTLDRAGQASAGRLTSS